MQSFVGKSQSRVSHCQLRLGSSDGKAGGHDVSPKIALQPSPSNYISSHVMEISGDAIAEVVLKEFEKWPAKRKPLVRSDGAKEWVPLSGIVAQGLPLKMAS
jgi:hypothetical protein